MNVLDFHRQADIDRLAEAWHSVGCSTGGQLSDHSLAACTPLGQKDIKEDVDSMVAYFLRWNGLFDPDSPYAVARLAAAAHEGCRRHQDGHRLEECDAFEQATSEKESRQILAELVRREAIR
jgi:hypothetical protein